VVLGPKVHEQQGARPPDRLHPLLEKGQAAAVHPVQVLDQRDAGLRLSGLLHQASQHAEELALARLGVHARRRLRRVGHPEELEEQRQHLPEALVDQQQPPGDLLTHAAIVVLLADAEVGAEDLEDGQEGDVPAVCHRVCFERGEPP
jgi:hypothetical protein